MIWLVLLILAAIAALVFWLLELLLGGTDA